MSITKQYMCHPEIIFSFLNYNYVGQQISVVILLISDLEII